MDRKGSQEALEPEVGVGAHEFCRPLRVPSDLGDAPCFVGGVLTENSDALLALTVNSTKMAGSSWPLMLSTAAQSTLALSMARYHPGSGLARLSVLEKRNGLQVENLRHVVGLLLLKVDLEEINGVVPGKVQTDLLRRRAFEFQLLWAETQTPVSQPESAGESQYN